MNTSHLTLTHFETRIADARRRAETAELAARNGRPRELAPADCPDHVVIRSAIASDDAEIARLAQLDSARMPGGAVIVAERHGRLVAAVAMDGGRVIADPFERTQDVVRLLELRASQLRDGAGGSARGKRRAAAGAPRRERASALLRLMRAA